MATHPMIPMRLNLAIGCISSHYSCFWNVPIVIYIYNHNNFLSFRKKILKPLFVATLTLGSRPRQRWLQGCGPKGSPGVTSHTPGSARKCEGENPHTPKATPTLKDGVPVDSRNFKKQFEGSNLNGL